MSHVKRLNYPNIITIDFFQERKNNNYITPGSLLMLIYPGLYLQSLFTRCSLFRQGGVRKSREIGQIILVQKRSNCTDFHLKQMV
jgi:hypothetical protein